MKKKWMVAALTAALVAQGSYAFAAGSPSSDDNHTVTAPSVELPPASPVIVAGSGQKTETAAPGPGTPGKVTVTVPSAGPGSGTQINVVQAPSAPNAATGSTIGVVVDTTTTAGVPITTNEKGEAVIGGTVVAFVDTNSAVSALPETVAEAVADINAGKPLQEAVTSVDLTGYNALTSAQTIVTKDAATDQVKTGPVEVSIYVPNLVENLEHVSVLFYDNAVGQWVLLPVVKMDAASRTVTVIVPGSGTLSVVYKAQ